MSRSYRKTPISGITTAESEAMDKRIWHKRMRARQRDRLMTDSESEPVHTREVSDPWGMGKDGKRWVPDAYRPKLMRK